MDDNEEPTKIDEESDRRRSSALAIYANIEAFYSKPQVFSDKGKCAGLPLEWFVISQSDTRPTKEMNDLNRSNLKKGLAVCVGCPLMYNGECYDKAEKMDRKWTIRGGEIPEVWDQDRDVMHNSASRAKPKRSECIRGHNLTLPGARTTRGHCQICQADKKARICRNGHDTSKPNSRYESNGACIQCNRENSKRAEIKRKEARAARLAANQATGVE